MKSVLKTAILVSFLFALSLNTAYLQTSMSLGEGNFYSFNKGEKSVFKLIGISQVNQTFDRFVLSALVAGVVDTAATGYVGTGLAYEVMRSRDLSQSIYLGVNAMKGEGDEALIGAGASLRLDKTLLSLTYERDITRKGNWVGFSIQQIILGTASPDNNGNGRGRGYGNGGGNKNKF